ncbi:MAG TPA: hypothetical protein PL048_16565 [Leptospiraceae bacterium]|nr:hypothetical protein [Leptospiraceae bacterium]HNF28492.1 hypothetical protein [Leptospiraceae bacterium]
MKSIILTGALLLSGITLYSQEQTEILEFTAFGTFNPKDSESKREKNCRGGFNNHIHILFQSEYRLIGSYPDFRFSAVHKDSSMKILDKGEIKYDTKTGLCSSGMKLEIPKSSVYSLVSSQKENGFKDNGTAVFSYNKKLDKESLYLSYLSCFNSKESFSVLIKTALGSVNEGTSGRINLSFPPGTVYSKCEIFKNSDCSCRIAFSRKNLKEEIRGSFKK